MRLLTLAYLCFLLSFPTYPQDIRDAAPVSQEPLRSRSELLVVQASVQDRHGNFLADLKRSQIRVFDDGVEQNIAIFDSVDSPAHVAVLIETSPAVYLIQGQHVAAAYSLLDGLAPSDEVAIATYDQSTRFVLGFTSNRALIARTLDGLQYFLGMGELNFYDAVNVTVTSLPAGIEKKALLLLSTGLDTSTQEHWNALERRLETCDVSIFSVGLGGNVRKFKSRKEAPPHEPSFQRADAALRDIARITGGQAYFPSSADEFVRAYRSISAQLRHEYLLAYPPPAHDGRVHTIEVRVVDDQGKMLGTTGSAIGLRVFARQTYLAPAD